MSGLAIGLESLVAVLAKACWQGGLVALVVWAICRILPSMPAQVQCWLWRLACVKFILVLLLPTLVDLPWLPAPAAISQPASAIATHAPGHCADQVRGGKSDEVPSLPWILGVLWILGFVWSLGRILVAWREARQLRRLGRFCRCAATVEQLQAVCRRFRLKTRPQCLEIAGSGSPVLIGILRPAIVLPVETLHALNPKEMAMVLGHELAHIQRGDLLWKLIAATVRAVFFFHPLVWLSQRQLNLSQEIAADALAIAQQPCDPIGYGKLLVSVVGKLGPARCIHRLSMGAAGSMESLTRRFVAMKRARHTSRRVLVASSIALGAAVVLGIVPWRLVAAESQGDKQPSPQYLATITISEQPKGHPKTVLSAPTLVFFGDQKASVSVGDSKRRLEATIGPSPGNHPLEHRVQVQIIQNPEGKNRVVQANPTFTVIDGQTGKVQLGDGASTLEIEATIKPVK